MDNEEKINVVWEGLMSDKTKQKIGVVPATVRYDVEKIGVVLEGLMYSMDAEKVGVCPRPSRNSFTLHFLFCFLSSFLFLARLVIGLPYRVRTRLISTSLDMDNS